VAVVDLEGRPLVAVPAGTEVGSDPSGWVHQPVRAGAQDYGAIVVRTDGTDLGEDDLVAVERAATAVAVRLAQAAAVAEAQERFAAITLEELVAGHAGDSADILERGASLGWDLSRPHAVLLASIDPPVDEAARRTALATIAAAARATLGRDAIVWARTSTIAALVAPASAEPAERRRLAEGLRRELDHRVRSVTVSIGVGRRAEGPHGLPASFTEASRAVDVGRWAKGRHVTEVFDELGLERLLAATPDEDLVGFVQQAIGPLVRYDHLHRTQLVDTLAAWLETRNMAEAARRLFVHYNTLKNRLDRVEDIIGPVVGDPARALECEIAIYVDRHYDIAWRDDTRRYPARP
jgi:purine catabolism regulator